MEVEVGGEFVEVEGGAIDLHADETEGAEVLEHQLVIAPHRGGEGEGHLEATLSGGKDGVGRATGAVDAHAAAADETELLADAGPEEAEVVVDLRRRADGGAAGDRRVPLLDRDRRGHAVEPVDQRFGHPLEELLGVGRERLDVPALPFGIQRVERERALPRAGRPGDRDERAARQIDGDALEIVLSGVDDADAGGGHGGKIVGSA